MHYGILGQAACTLAPYNIKHSPPLSPRDCCRSWAVLFCGVLTSSFAMHQVYTSKRDGRTDFPKPFWVNP